jgi:hypothetical protein
MPPSVSILTGFRRVENSRDFPDKRLKVGSNKSKNSMLNASAMNAVNAAHCPIMIQQLSGLTLEIIPNKETLHVIDRNNLISPEELHCLWGKTAAITVSGTR